MHDECLNEELFLDLEDARNKISRWRQYYNEQRPHSSLGMLAPREFAARSGAEVIQRRFRSSINLRTKLGVRSEVYIVRLHAPCFLLLLAAGTSLAPGTPGSAPVLDNRSRLRGIALAYAEAYETVRRFEEYSLQRRDLAADVLTDEAYFEKVFNSTSLDVRGTMVAEAIEDVEFRAITFYRVYASTMSPLW